MRYIRMKTASIANPPDADTANRSRRLGRVLPLLIAAAALMMGGGCAYFNAYYLVQKNYQDAESARRRQQEPRMREETKKMYRDTIVWSQEVIEKYPDSRYVDDSYFHAGLAHFRLEEYVLARASFEELIRRFPASDLAPEATYYLAQTHIETERWEDARLLLEGLMAAEDRDLRGDAGLSLAEIAHRNGEWSRLLEAADRVIEADVGGARDTRAKVYRAEALSELERFDEAIVLLESIAGRDMEPDLRFTVNTLLARATAGNGEYDKALVYLTAMTGRGEFASYDSKIRLEIGKIEEIRGRTDEAVQVFRNLAGDYPDSLQAREAWFRVGDILIRDLANADEARQAFENAAKNTARGGEDRYAVQATIRVTQIDSIRAKLDRIEKTEDAAVRAHTRYTLAELYTHSFERPDAALEQYAKILEESPDSEYAVLASYFITRAKLAEDGDVTETEIRDMMTVLEQEYPDSEYTRKLMVLEGLIEQTPADAAYAKAEEAWLGGAPPAEYLSLYRAVADSFPNTGTGYKARFALAYLTEHEANDLEAALTLYRALAEEEPTFINSEYVMMAREKLDYHSREGEMLAAVNRYLQGFESGAGEAVEAASAVNIAASDTGVDTGLTGYRKIRSRNAHIRSRYYTN